MLTGAQIWLAIKALIAILPAIVFMVRDGRIKSATEKEILNAILDLSSERVDRAVAARNAPDSGVPDDSLDRDR